MAFVRGVNQTASNPNSFYYVLHAKVVIAGWNHECIHLRPHSSLHFKTPIKCIQDCAQRK